MPTSTDAAAAHYKRVFDTLLNHGFAESEEATPEQWADELCEAIEAGAKIRNGGVTEAEVARFMQKHAAELARATGKDFTYVYLSAGNPNYPNAPLEVQWKVYVDDCDHVSGKSLNTVMQQAIAIASPEERARIKRAEAAKLLAEAAALVP